jgi:hypothetical protein
MEPTNKLPTRHAATSISIDPNVRCLRVYPTEDTKRTIDALKTVGIRMSKAQAIHLARVLLAVTQDWEDVDITAYRSDPRKEDGTYRVTVTSPNRPSAEA